MSSLSGTTAFELPVDEIVNEAWRRAGVYDNLTADHARIGRLCLNLVLQDLQNEGVLLWQTELRTLTLTASTATYTLPSDTNDILDGALIESANRIVLERLSQQQWLELARESIESRPLHYRVDRLRGSTTITFWPVPEDNGFSFEYLALKQPNDITAANQAVDIPARLQPAIIAMLAVHLYDGQYIDGEFHIPKMAQLEKRAEATLRKALLEDRERTSFHLRPSFRGYRAGRRR